MGSETCKPQKGELGGQDGPRRPKTPGPIISHFGSGSCQSVRLAPPDLTTTSCNHFCSSAILSKQGIETQIVQPSTFFGTMAPMAPMAQADQALSFFTKFELYCYETLKTRQENLSSCRRELRKLSWRIKRRKGGQKGLSASTLKQKETLKKEILKKELKADITKLKLMLKPAWNRVCRIRKKNETKTKKNHMAMKKINDKKTKEINDKKTKDDKPMTRGKQAEYMSCLCT